MCTSGRGNGTPGSSAYAVRPVAAASRFTLPLPGKSVACKSTSGSILMLRSPKARPALLCVLTVTKTKPRGAVAPLEPQSEAAEWT